MRPLSILYAEDEMLIAMCIIEALEDYGHQVCHFPTGDAAAAQLHRGCFDVLLTDLRMPGDTNGLDLIARARQGNPGLPVVLITGTPPQNMRRDEITAVIEKPCLLADVVRTIARVASAVPTAAPSAAVAA